LYILRLSAEASITFTWTVEVMFSQIRGGENMMVGPTSRIFSWTVSGFSGKFTVKPVSSALERHIICSPIHASGRKETNSSFSNLLSTSIRFAAMLRKLRNASIAPLGKPVVPEV
jgi:hypothetical protein